MSAGTRRVGCSRQIIRLTRGDLAAGALALALLLPGITEPFWDRDEAEYAGAAHAMAATGNLVVPSLFGKPYADKPPLVFWLTAGSFRIFGESEAAGRLPHVLLAGCSAALASLLARRWTGGASTLGGLTLATSLLFVVYGRLLLTDSALLFFTLLAVLALRQACDTGRRSLLLVCGGIALGFAVLAKGPVAFLVPGLVACAAERSRRWRSLSDVLGMSALAVAMAAPWFLMVAARTGGSAARSFFVRENLERFLHPMEHHTGPFLFYAPVMLLGFFPWSGHLFRSVFWRRDGNRRVLVVWVAGILIFFSMASTKLPHYILPAVPALAILLAGTAPLHSAREVRLVAWTAATVGVVLFGAAVAAASRVEFPSLLLPSIVALGVVALFSLSLPLASSPKRAGAFVVHAVAVSAVIAGVVPASLERGRCLSALGRAAESKRVEGEPLGGWDIEEPALKYYARADDTRKWKRVPELARAIERSGSRSALVWIAGDEAAFLPRAGSVSLSILASGDNLFEPGRRGTLLLCRARLRCRQPPSPCPLLARSGGGALQSCILKEAET